MNKNLCSELIPKIIDMLWKLPKPTAGFGLPMVGDSKYITYAQVRMNLCIIVRDMVEQNPRALLPAIVGFKKKVDDAKRNNWISMAEFIVFLEGDTVCRFVP